MPNQNFTRNERLKREKTIVELFKKGSSFYLYPFRITFLPNDPHSGHLPAILIAVSKRNFKKAVDRNKIKRLIREAYRLNKSNWVSSPSFPSYLAITYVAKEILALQAIQNKLNSTFKRFLI